MPQRTMRIDPLMFKTHRKRAGLSQKALAKKAGLSAPQVSRIEGGKVDPFVRTAERLAEAMDANPSAFAEDPVDWDEIVEERLYPNGWW